MSNRELQVYEYVNRPYVAVRDAVLADPEATLRHGADLHVSAGPVVVGALIDIKVVSVEEDTAYKPRTRVQVEWSAVRNPRLFPTMRGTLSIYPLSPTETQLDFAGSYDPPLGVVGDALDAVALQRLARASVDGFIKDVARSLCDTAVANRATPRVSSRANP